MNHLVRKPDAGNPPVRFDERGVETESTANYSGTGNRKGRSQLRLRLNSTAPLLDSTAAKAPVPRKQSRSAPARGGRSLTTSPLMLAAQIKYKPYRYINPSDAPVSARPQTKIRPDPAKS